MTCSASLDASDRRGGVFILLDRGVRVMFAAKGLHGVIYRFSDLRRGHGVHKEHLKTDLRMYIEGKLQSSEFTAEDGSKVQKLEVVGQTFKFVDNKKTASE